jgi:hypothetical protein
VKVWVHRRRVDALLAVVGRQAGDAVVVDRRLVVEDVDLGGREVAEADLHRHLEARAEEGHQGAAVERARDRRQRFEGWRRFIGEHDEAVVESCRAGRCRDFDSKNKRLLDWARAELRREGCQLQTVR